MLKKTQLYLVRIIAVFLLAVSSVLVPSGSALAVETIYENFTSTTGQQWFTAAIGSDLIAQSFGVESNHNVTAVNLKLYKQLLGGTGTVYASIRATEKKTFTIDDTDYILDVPKGPDLASGYISDAGITTSTSGSWYKLNLDNPVQLTSGNFYAIVLSSTANPMRWALSPMYDYGNASAGSSYSATWNQADPFYDFLFEVIGDPDVVGSIPTATGTGTIHVNSSSGTMDSSSIRTVSVDDLPQEAQDSMPVNTQFDHGLIGFTIVGLETGASVDITLTFPDNLPPTTTYWKWANGWVSVPVGSNDGDNVIVITLVDGGPGDMGGADGVIEDDGGPAVPAFGIDFTAEPLEGPSPLTVQFQDLSFGEIDAWEWDFENDGIVDSNERNPVHVFVPEYGVKAESYDVQLTINMTGGGSYNLVKNDYVTAHKPPITDFKTLIDTQVTGPAPHDVYFARLNPEGGGYQEYFLWDFGDGSNSTSANPGWHTYASPGFYTVSLWVKGPGGTDTETKEDFIIVTGGPVAHFTASPTSGTAPLAVQFTNLSMGDLTSFSWDFDNSGSIDSTEFNPVYTYTTPGVYTVVLSADGSGDSSNETRVDYITVEEPEIVAGDANGDGVINVEDITKVTRIILEQDLPTPWADANQDTVINILDMTKIARIILGLE